MLQYLSMLTHLVVSLIYTTLDIDSPLQTWNI